MLLQAAADQWKVPVDELTVADGVITHAASKRSTTYGKVAVAASKLTPPDPKSIKLKDPRTWKIAGQPLAAGSYGLHMILAADGGVTAIFSKVNCNSISS